MRLIQVQLMQGPTKELVLAAETSAQALLKGSSRLLLSFPLLSSASWQPWASNFWKTGHTAGNILRAACAAVSWSPPAEALPASKMTGRMPPCLSSELRAGTRLDLTSCGVAEDCRAFVEPA